jgi:hypothetical protein
MPVYRLKTPLSTEEVAKLRVGDTVYVSGIVVAALCTGVGERYPSSLIAVGQVMEMRRYREAARRVGELLREK